MQFVVAPRPYCFQSHDRERVDPINNIRAFNAETVILNHFIVALKVRKLLSGPLSHGRASK